jgi:hypothetical protein
MAVFFSNLKKSKKNYYRYSKIFDNYSTGSLHCKCNLLYLLVINIKKNCIKLPVHLFSSLSYSYDPDQDSVSGSNQDPDPRPWN